MTALCECPQCKQRIEFDSGAAGTAIDCPACQQKMILPQSIPVARIASGPIQTKTNVNATTLKVVGALLMFIGVPGCGYGAEVNHDGVMWFWMIACAAGFVLFIIGRFSE
jgi:DNA-directed RNA polymerase subunit RPC12/RpoP